MQEFAARAYYVLCLALGRLLRSARYSVVGDTDARFVRKHRSFYAPILIWLGGLVVRILDAGMRVLPQREWEARERRIYQVVYGTSIQVDAGGALVLPHFPGRTLAALLEDSNLSESERTRAIELAVVALVAFHGHGFTHGDAMAENVLVDSLAARWFDFETLHDPHRAVVWQRADDLRALLVTCLVRTVPEKRAERLEFILDVYGDDKVARVMAKNFASVWRRSLAFHLAQAPLSFDAFRKVGTLLGGRS